MWVQEAACKEHVVLGKQCGNLPAVLSSSGTLRGKKPYRVLHVAAIHTSPGLLSVWQLLLAPIQMFNTQKTFKQLRFNPKILLRAGKPGPPSWWLERKSLLLTGSGAGC